MPSLQLECSSRTETGRRANNEDAVWSSPRLVAVADGVGGAAAGEVASRWAINAMIALEKRRLTEPLEVALADAVAGADATLAFLVDCRPELTGMGTTLTAVALSDAGEYLVANVGDSRTYLCRSRRLRRLSRDDSFVQELLDRGELTAEQARDHPQRSLVLDALDGRRRPPRPPGRHRAFAGDRLLLCSDGLTDYVADAEIARGLAGSRTATAARLVGLALERGSRDNVSVVVADVVERPPGARGWPRALPAAPPPP